jgi:hypothetical protein
MVAHGVRVIGVEGDPAVKKPLLPMLVAPVDEQADAPLATIEMVVAGVTQRRDEATEPERLDADAVRTAIAAGTWTAPAR